MTLGGPTASGLVGVVVNPTAAQGRGARTGARVANLLRGHGHDVLDLSGADAAQALGNARQAVIDGLAALVVVGGDGMVHLGVNAVAATGTPLGIVAAGSGNDLARTVELPLHDAADACRVIVDALREGRSRPLDAVRVTGSDPMAGVWYAGVFSAGLDAAVNARANRLTWPHGHLKYLRAVVGELGIFRPYSYRVTTDDEVWESDGTLVAVANGPMFGGGIRIVPEARLDDGMLDVVLAGPLTRPQVLRLFPQLYSGRHVRSPAVRMLRSRQVTIEAGPGNPPPPAFADGEEIGALPWHLRVHAGAVRLLV